MTHGGTKKVVIYTDGACSGNPGPGGWGAILIWGEHRKELCGGAADTTNNRMELQAVIEALGALTRAAHIDLLDPFVETQRLEDGRQEAR
jgi:ribonuclease HI